MVADDQHLRVTIFSRPGDDSVHWELRGECGPYWQPPTQSSPWPAIPLLRSMPAVSLSDAAQAPVAIKLAATIGRPGQYLAAQMDDFGQLVLYADPQPVVDAEILDQLYIMLGRLVSTQPPTQLVALQLEWRRHGLPDQPAPGHLGRRQLRVAQRLLGQLIDDVSPHV